MNRSENRTSEAREGKGKLSVPNLITANVERVFEGIFIVSSVA